MFPSDVSPGEVPSPDRTRPHTADPAPGSPVPARAVLGDTVPPGADAKDTPPPGSVARDSLPAADDPVSSLLGVLDLKPDPSGRRDAFVGHNQPQPWGRVFGGQLLAQALVAAQRTVHPARPVHSLHAYFLRGGDVHEPLTMCVERFRDGRSFSARQVLTSQHGRPILSLTASFQLDTPGPEHQAPMPDVPAPESLPSLEERYRHLDEDAGRGWRYQRPVDLRHVEEPIYLSAAAERRAHQAVWLRVIAPLDDDPRLHAAVLAYASDYTLLEPVLRRHGLPWSHPGLRVASLDHAMWWHRPARADEWLLYVHESPSASGARGLCQGRIYTREGLLVCSVAQEGMIRVPQPVDLGSEQHPDPKPSGR